jgi:hypothetical protein
MQYRHIEIAIEGTLEGVNVDCINSKIEKNEAKTLI